MRTPRPNQRSSAAFNQSPTANLPGQFKQHRYQRDWLWIRQLPARCRRPDHRLPLPYVATIYTRIKSFAPYAEDHWKVTKKLVIDAGLRWDYLPPVHEKIHHFSPYSQSERHESGHGLSRRVGVCWELWWCRKHSAAAAPRRSRPIGRTGDRGLALCIPSTTRLCSGPPRQSSTHKAEA